MNNNIFDLGLKKKESSYYHTSFACIIKTDEVNNGLLVDVACQTNKTSPSWASYIFLNKQLTQPILIFLLFRSRTKQYVFTKTANNSQKEFKVLKYHQFSALLDTYSVSAPLSTPKKSSRPI